MLSFGRSSKSSSPANLKKAQQGVDAFFARTDLGFKDLVNRSSLWALSQERGAWIAAEADDFILVGIGGSSLGAEVLRDNLPSPKRVHVCDNVDPWQMQQILSKIVSWKRTHVLIVSKSGGTLETLLTAEFFLAELKKNELSYSRHVTVITEPVDNSLSQWARKQKVLALELPVDVGGRYSVLSPVGMVLAAALGASVSEFRLGAEQALAARQVAIQFVAESLESFDRQEWITFFWTYASSMKSFGFWFQQLWAESLAKKQGRRPETSPARVSTPMSGVGACDQHSLLQQFMEGARDKWILQLRVKSQEAQGPLLGQSSFQSLQWLSNVPLGKVLASEAEATYLGLEQNEVSLRELFLQDLSPKSLGFLFMFLQIVVASLGEALDLNAFDQPGVELGKRLAKEILQK